MKTLLASLLIFAALLGLAQPAWDDQKRHALTEKCEANLTRTFLVYQDGDEVFKYGDDTAVFPVFSVRKSLVSLLFGIYAEKGKIDVNATLEQLGIDDLEPLSAAEKQATVFQLLQARSGVYHPAAFETSSMRRQRPERGSQSPGTHWYYNNWDFNALTTIFEQATGMSVFQAFDEQVAQPLGLRDFSVNDQEYIFEEARSVHKATFWKLSGRDLGTIGTMLLDQGRVGQKQVVTADWIEQSATAYSDAGLMGGYGLCWWVATEGRHYPFVTLPEGTFMALGTGLQHLLVLPTYNMVIVHQTLIESPEDERMKVTALARIIKLVLDQ